MKIIIAGGSGQLGTILARAFQADGQRVMVLSRKTAAAAAAGPWRAVTWDAKKLGDWAGEFENADVVINLAGRSVNCRYNDENRREILDSRVDSTRLVGQAIAAASNPPPLWLQMSTATVYAHRLDAPNDEYTGIIGGDEPDVPETWNFSIEVARQWERAVDEAITPDTRKIKMRSAMVMSPDGGSVFETLLTLVKRGLGGRAGDGRQYVSWIHFEDFIRAVYWLIEDKKIEGAVNLAAPNPVTNAEFMSGLRAASGVPFGLPATKLMLEIGAVFMKTETELILKSRRVVPTKLLDAGFNFKFETWQEAARDLCLQYGRK
jgi:uncharacterized protein (TIGR01777 family)